MIWLPRDAPAGWGIVKEHEESYEPDGGVA
jgi:hypothetical protein